MSVSQFGQHGVFDRESNITKNAADAIEEAIAWQTACIVSDDGKFIGTCTLIRWRQRELILTARHVVQDCSKEGIRFHFRPEGTMKRAPISELHSHPEVRYRQKVRVEIAAKHIARSFDLAALELSGVLPPEHLARFFELSDRESTPEIGTPVALRGYPSD